MTILGIDPGIAITGYGIIKTAKNNQLFMIEYGCIRTSKEDEHADRLFKIYTDLRKILKKYKLDTIAIENIYFAKNVKTAMKVSEARGVVVLACSQSRAQIFEFTPLQVKQSLTGYGRATKVQVQKMVKLILELEDIPKPDDAADALAVAITCIQTKKYLT
ncbi:crossover junction endodeoxyribonuclease RuvC [Patescibacteria group bacterium AH-259-L05]|nr:crossover junction endodeoxyribonuclease RuvC [Patescibacteria group bacterium AH-259-L05]